MTGQVRKSKSEGYAIRLLSVASRSYLAEDDKKARAHREFVGGSTRSGFAVEVLKRKMVSIHPLVV